MAARTQVDLVGNTDWLQALQLAAAQAPDVIRRYVQKDLRSFVSNMVDQRLRRSPGPVVYPIEWASARQRRAYFATDGFGHGIPYQRTGQFVKGWHVQVDYAGGFSGLAISHDSDRERFITGKRQQPFHHNTGWPYSPEVFQIILLELENRIEDGLPTVLDEVFSV